MEKDDVIIVKSKVRELAKDSQIGNDFYVAFNKLAINLLKDAKERAKENGRKTLQAKDVFIGKINDEFKLVMVSKLRELREEFNLSGDFVDALSTVLAWYFEQAKGRATANGRKTIGARDL